MAVVEAIAASEDGMRLQDLARSVGLTAGAVHHIVDTLVAGGWLERGTQPVRYRLGQGLVGIAHRQGRRRMTAVIDAAMIELLAASGGESVSCCEASGNEILLTRAVRGDRPATVVPVVGTVLPPYTSAASVVHLACWPEERAAGYRELRPFEVHAGQMWKGRDAFEAAVAGVRRAGHVDLPLAERTSLRIGFPVFAAAGNLVASLTVTAIQVADPAAARERIVAAGLRATAGIRAALAA